jgi:hemolysin III
VFFVIDSRLRYGHLVWHLFVVGGTVSHYFSIFYYGA